MAVSMPSGLGGSLGYVAEVTPGTAVTVSRWLRFEKETLQLQKIIAHSVGLHQGLYQETKRRALVAKEVKGNLDSDLVDTGLGLLFKHALGASTGATVIAGTAFTSTAYPADQTGLSLTLQVGRPFNTGTIQAFTYTGCKINDFMIGVKRGELAKFNMTIDGWAESTAIAYAAPTIPSNNVLHFAQGALLLGGTLATGAGPGGIPAANYTTVTSGAAPVAVVAAADIKVTNALHDKRFTIGSTTKKEQLSNGFRKVEGTLELEFANLADVYTAFAADSFTALQLNFTGGAIAGGSGNNAQCNITCSNIVFESPSGPIIEGPDVLLQKVKFSAFDDGTNNVIQIYYVSTDTTI